ncbi:MAG: hypothetical protein ACK55Z_36970, partial [bacterium]
MTRSFSPPRQRTRSLETSTRSFPRSHSSFTTSTGSRTREATFSTACLARAKPRSSPPSRASTGATCAS